MKQSLIRKHEALRDKNFVREIGELGVAMLGGMRNFDSNSFRVQLPVSFDEIT